MNNDRYFERYNRALIARFRRQHVHRAVELLRKAGTVPRSANVGLGAVQSPFSGWLGLQERAGIRCRFPPARLVGEKKREA